MSIDSAVLAASIAATAMEIAAAAALYQRLPAQRNDLVAGLESLVEALEHEWAVFARKRAEEAAHAQR